MLPGSADYTDEFAELLADAINEGMRYAWRAAWWPDVVAIEERQFAETWDTNATYQEGDFVCYEDLYYVALRETIGDQPDTATSDWELTTAYDLYIAREQDWEDQEIGEFKHITDRDPRKSRVPYHYLFTTDSDGAWLTSNCSSATVWVTFRKPAPRFGWEEWDETETAYTLGDLVIGDDGNCYEWIQTTDGNTQEPSLSVAQNAGYWALVEFPECFEPFALHWARAWYLRDDGQDDKATAEEEAAEWALQNLSLELFGGQDQQETPVRMSGYGVKAGRR